jgi:hypothetical protein
MRGTVGIDVRDYKRNTDFRLQGDGKVGIHTTAPLRALQLGAHGSAMANALASSTTGQLQHPEGGGATAI